MLPDPIIGKHYILVHKKTGNNPFRGYIQIVQKGHINGLLIFRTSISSSNWYFWDDYNFEYIGDLA